MTDTANPDVLDAVTLAKWLPDILAAISQDATPSQATTTASAPSGGGVRMSYATVNTVGVSDADVVLDQDLAGTVTTVSTLGVVNVGDRVVVLHDTAGAAVIVGTAMGGPGGGGGGGTVPNGHVISDVFVWDGAGWGPRRDSMGFNVLDFGAVGDFDESLEGSPPTVSNVNNIANHTINDTAFTAAVALAKSLKGSLVIPSGKYGISPDILATLAADIGFHGEDEGTTILFPIGTGTGISQSITERDYWLDQSRREMGRPGITGITVDGTFAGTGSVGVRCGPGKHAKYNFRVVNYTGATGDPGVVGVTGSIGILIQNRTMDLLPGATTPALATVTAITATASTDTFTKTLHGLSNGARLRVISVGTTDLLASTVYFVVAAAANTFQLSLSAGGAAIDLTADGTIAVQVTGYSSASAVNATDTFTRTAHGFVNGDIVHFSSVGGTGLALNTAYYVIAATANTFQVSATVGGGAFAILADASVTVLAGPPLGYQQFTESNVFHVGANNCYNGMVIDRGNGAVSVGYNTFTHLMLRNCKNHLQIKNGARLYAMVASIESVMTDSITSGWEIGNGITVLGSALADVPNPSDSRLSGWLQWHYEIDKSAPFADILLYSVGADNMWNTWGGRIDSQTSRFAGNNTRIDTTGPFHHDGPLSIEPFPAASAGWSADQVEVSDVESVTWISGSSGNPSIFTKVGDWSRKYAAGSIFRWREPIHPPTSRPQQYGSVLSATYDSLTNLTTITLNASATYWMAETPVLGSLLVCQPLPPDLPTEFLPWTPAGGSGTFLVPNTFNPISAYTTLRSVGTSGLSQWRVEATGAFDVGHTLGSYTFDGATTVGNLHTSPLAGVFAHANEAFDATHGGTYVSVGATPRATTAISEAARFVGLGFRGSTLTGDIANLMERQDVVSVTLTAGSTAIVANPGSLPFRSFRSEMVDRYIHAGFANTPINYGTRITAVADSTHATMSLPAVTSTTVLAHIGAFGSISWILGGSYETAGKYAENMSLRTSDLFIGHSSYMPFGNPGGGGQRTTNALIISVDHYFDDNNYQQGAQSGFLGLGPSGLVQVEGVVVVGPNAPALDTVGGPVFNNMMSYRNEDGTNTQPGGMITGLADSSGVTISGGSMVCGPTSSFWTNRIWRSSGAGGVLRISDFTGYTTVDFMDQDSGTTLQIGRWTGYHAQPPVLQDTATNACLHRAVGFEFGFVANRTIDVATTNGSDIVTAAAGAGTFSDEDIGAFISNSARAVFGGHTFIIAVSTVNANGSQARIATPANATNASLLIDIYDQYLYKTNSATMPAIAARFAGQLQMYPTGTARGAHTWTSAAPDFITSNGKHIIDFANPLLPTVFNVGGTFQFNQTTGIFGTGQLIDVAPTIQNQSGTGLSAGPFTMIDVHPTIFGQTPSFGASPTAFSARPTFTGTVGGTSQNFGLRSKITVSGGAHVTDHFNVYIDNATLASGGTLTNQYGIFINSLSGASTNNIGIFNNAELRQNGLATFNGTVDFTGATVVGLPAASNVLKTDSSTSTATGFGLATVLYADTATAGIGPSHILRRSRSGGAVLADDAIGKLQFSGSDGTGYVQSVSVAAYADEAWSGGAHGGRLELATASSGGTATPRIVIDRDGNVGVGTSTATSLLTVQQTGHTVIGETLADVELLFTMEVKGGIHSHTAFLGLDFLATEYGGATGGSLDLRQTRAPDLTTLAANVNTALYHTQSGDTLGLIHFGGSKYNALSADAAVISVTATADFSPTSSPTQFNFRTNPIGAYGSPTTVALTLGPDGTATFTSAAPFGLGHAIVWDAVTGGASGGPSVLLQGQGVSGGVLTGMPTSAVLGQLSYQGYNSGSAGYLTGANIKAISEEAFTTVAHRGTRIEIQTAAIGTSAAATRLILDNAGKLWGGATPGAANWWIDQAGNASFTSVTGTVTGSSPLTTKGDIYVYSTTDTRLAVSATNGQALVADSATATGLNYRGVLLLDATNSIMGAFGAIVSSYGTPNLVNFRRANGSLGSETQVLAGQVVTNWQSSGYNNTNATFLSAANVIVTAEQDFTATNVRGSRIEFWTAPSDAAGAPVANAAVASDGNFYAGGNLAYASNAVTSARLIYDVSIKTLSLIADTAAASVLRLERNSGAAVISGGGTGSITFRGYDGSAVFTGATLDAVTTQLYTAGANGGTRLRMRVAPTNSQTLAQAVTIDNDGTVSALGVGTATTAQACSAYMTSAGTIVGTSLDAGAGLIVTTGRVRGGVIASDLYTMRTTDFNVINTNNFANCMTFSFLNATKYRLRAVLICRNPTGSTGGLKVGIGVGGGGTADITALSGVLFDPTDNTILEAGAITALPASGAFTSILGSTSTPGGLFPPNRNFIVIVEGSFRTTAAGTISIAFAQQGVDAGHTMAVLAGSHYSLDVISG